MVEPFFHKERVPGANEIRWYNARTKEHSNGQSYFHYFVFETYFPSALPSMHHQPAHPLHHTLLIQVVPIHAAQTYRQEISCQDLSSISSMLH